VALLRLTAPKSSHFAVLSLRERFIWVGWGIGAPWRRGGLICILYRECSVLAASCRAFGC